MALPRSRPHPCPASGADPTGEVGVAQRPGCGRPWAAADCGLRGAAACELGGERRRAIILPGGRHETRRRGGPMEGLMQNTPLTVGAVFRRAEAMWPTKRLATAGRAGVDR